VPCELRGEAAHDTPQLAGRVALVAASGLAGVGWVSPVAGAEDHDRAGEGRTLRRLPELQPASEEADFAADRIRVPPGRIRPGGHQADDRRPGLGGFKGLAHPLPNLAAIGGIHENHVPRPVLRQAVLTAREVTGAAGVGVGAARVEAESEFLVQQTEQPVRRRPLIRARREMDRQRPTVLWAGRWRWRGEKLRLNPCFWRRMSGRVHRAISRRLMPKAHTDPAGAKVADLWTMQHPAWDRP